MSMAGGYGIWADRLELAQCAVASAFRNLYDEQNGPFRGPSRLAGWGTWQGAVGDHFQRLIGRLDRQQLGEFLEHLGRFRNALERLHTEVYHAAQAEKANLAPPRGIDIDAGLRPWREWPAASVESILGFGWNQPPTGGAAVFMDLAGVRNLARSLGHAADDIETIRRDLARGLDHIGLAAPPFLTSLAGAASAVGDEIRRRADRMEEADRQVAAQFNGLAASLLAPASGVVSRFSDAVRKIAATMTDHRRVANDPKAPLIERYEANRWLIRYEIQRMERKCQKWAERVAKYERDALGNPQAGANIAWLQRETRRMHKKIDRFEGWADDPTRQFIMFDPKGDGRVAEVFGDLGSAAHLAVMVPGMRNEMANYDAQFRPSGENLQKVAGAETAVIAWLGYDTPEGIDGAAGIQTERGGKALAKFMDDLSAYGDKHTTVVAHSYGTTVAAHAAAYRGMEVDNLVMVGSPGLGIAPNRDFGPTRLWYGDTGSDPVSNWLRPIHGPGAHQWDGTRFSTDGASRHSEYFNPQTRCLDNIRRIVVGAEVLS